MASTPSGNQRRDDVLRRMLKTPPKPHAPLKVKPTANRPKPTRAKKPKAVKTH